VAADHRKRVSRKRELMQEDVGAVSQAPDPEEALQARQQHEVLIMLLDRLDPDRREVVVLHDLEGHSMPEIAEMLGVGLNTLYSRLRLGREQLARDLRRARIKDMAR
jgi:RNA polymerase sigma-70 factor (ECF subfamily)